VACFFYLQLDLVAILSVAPSFLIYIATEFMPPSFSNTGEYLSTVLTTVTFALVSTLISAVLSLFIAFLMTDVIMPFRVVRGAVRFLMTLIRNIPVVIWAFIMVLIFGAWPIVGLMALIIATTAFLSRSYAESIQEISARKLEPMRASGVGRLATIRHGLLSEFAPAWMNWTLFALELNVRASAVLGMVGVAVGLGTTIQTQLQLRRFNEVATMALILILVVVTIEFASNFARKKIMDNTSKISPHGKELRTVPLAASVKKWMLVGGVALLFFASLRHVDLGVARFIGRLDRVPPILRLMASINFDAILPGLQQLFVSFAMGLVGLMLGGALAFVLAFLAADNIAPNKALAIAIKAFVSTIRAVPSLIFILMIVAAVGLAYTAGVVVLILSSMGYLTKAFIGTIEEQHKGLITAMRATGAGWWQIVLHGLLPAAWTGFLAWLAIRLETSVAESVTLGVVSASVGGIGALLARAERHRDFPTITTLLIIIVIGMVLLECLANHMRKRV